MKATSHEDVERKRIQKLGNWQKIGLKFMWKMGKHKGGREREKGKEAPN